MDDRIILARAAAHVGGAVESGDCGGWPALGQDRGAVARSATEIDHSGGRGRVDARDEIAAGLRALVGESEVLAGIPIGHGYQYGVPTRRRGVCVLPHT